MKIDPTYRLQFDNTSLPLYECDCYDNCDCPDIDPEILKHYNIETFVYVDDDSPDYMAYVYSSNKEDLARFETDVLTQTVWTPPKPAPPPRYEGPKTEVEAMNEEMRRRAETSWFGSVWASSAVTCDSCTFEGGQLRSVGSIIVNGISYTADSAVGAGILCYDPLTNIYTLGSPAPIQGKHFFRMSDNRCALCLTHRIHDIQQNNGTHSACPAKPQGLNAHFPVMTPPDYDNIVNGDGSVIDKFRVRGVCECGASKCGSNIHSPWCCAAAGTP